MKANYFNFKDIYHIYDYECMGCGHKFSRVPTYVDKSTSVKCKHCPECGHKFEITEGVSNGSK